jgi:hypothetical protein
MLRTTLIALGKEFRRLGMLRHVEQLASYFRSNQGNVPPYGWDDEHVRDWCKRLRIPPYESALPVLPRSSPCPKCGPAVFGGRRTRVTFPGGAEFACGGCNAAWLELDASPGRGIEARS